MSIMKRNLRSWNLILSSFFIKLWRTKPTKYPWYNNVFFSNVTSDDKQVPKNKIEVQQQMIWFNHQFQIKSFSCGPIKIVIGMFLLLRWYKMLAWKDFFALRICPMGYVILRLLKILHLFVYLRINTNSLDTATDKYY